MRNIKLEIPFKIMKLKPWWSWVGEHMYTTCIQSYYRILFKFIYFFFYLDMSSTPSLDNNNAIKFSMAPWWVWWRHCTKKSGDDEWVRWEAFIDFLRDYPKRVLQWPCKVQINVKIAYESTATVHQENEEKQYLNFKSL